MQPAEARPPLEIWGGVECSHIRIGDVERDQCAENGHRDRMADLDLIAGLGIKALRYPMLWATIERADGSFDFTWAKARFERIRDLGIRPVAGFLHHGSGPGGLDPLDPDFVARFARFADAVAERVEGVEDFTPVNEPVTTARFACLYGHWHPHLAEESSFLRALVGKMRATQVAMAALRLRIPRARLIQTEDFGRVFARPALAYQAEYENERRFLGIDLLTGRVDRSHFFWRRLVAAGVDLRDLDALLDAPCPPDILGIDQYLTSDRFLDDDLARHPGAPPGGNGRAAYADVAAAHIDELRDKTGVLPRLRELHARYRLPIAITENHNGCTREEQLRWLMEGWRAAETARAEGMDMRAVTSWALFGARDWTSLMVRDEGFYESGAFDLRPVLTGGSPRITAVGRAVAALARHGDYRHPLVELGGWWRGAVEPGRVTHLPKLGVVGPPAETARIVECCRLRRIPVFEGQHGSSLRLGEMRVAPSRRGGTIVFAYRSHGEAAPHLEVEAPAGADFVCAVHAFLDLVIDGEAGRFRLENLGPHNQYVAVRPAADPTLQEQTPIGLAQHRSRSS